MPFDEDLAQRVRTFADRVRLKERKMFGGLGFFHQGNMCCGVWKDAFIARVGPDAYAKDLTLPGAQEFDITGRPMKGWILVQPVAIAEDADLENWFERCLRFVSTLPPK